MSVFIVLMPFPVTSEPQDGLIGPERVAEILGCSVDSVRRGKAAAKGLKRFQRRPLRFRLKDVHAHLNVEKETRQGLIRRRPR